MDEAEREQKIQAGLDLLNRRSGKPATPAQRAAIEDLVDTVEGLREDYGDERTSEMLDALIKKINQKIN